MSVDGGSITMSRGFCRPDHQILCVIMNKTSLSMLIHAYIPTHIHSHAHTHHTVTCLVPLPVLFPLPRT